MPFWGRTCIENKSFCTCKSDATYWILYPYSENHKHLELRKALAIISNATSVFHIEGKYGRHSDLANSMHNHSPFLLPVSTREWNS